MKKMTTMSRIHQDEHEQTEPQKTEFKKSGEQLSVMRYHMSEEAAASPPLPLP